MDEQDVRAGTPTPAAEPFFANPELERHTLFETPAFLQRRDVSTGGEEKSFDEPSGKARNA
jgi:hypothetical protein